LVLDQGYSRAEAARSLGLNSNMLCRWVLEHRADDGQSFRGNGKLTPEQEEIRKLRSQVKNLKMEKEILKKATVDSTGRRNTEYSEIYTGGFCDGSTWQAWFKRYTERGTLATMA
jgi:transposase-like protein